MEQSRITRGKWVQDFGGLMIYLIVLIIFDLYYPVYRLSIKLPFQAETIEPTS
ncbi:MAG: hypothetical protein JSV04_14320 [Candidatus Heimdallarchaeota archaeon]|nr:MAG: hypothetical protein JSV04_14320 [Candidatus Heimdallarchaeota archaeon]